MARSSEIIVSADPKGVFKEGTVFGTPKPGSLMQLKAATAPVGGRFTWEPLAPGTDGLPRLIAVLLPDSLQGKLATDAYVTGTRCFLYCPIPGEELNVLIGEVAGTANTYAIGDLLMVDAEDGLLVPNSTGTAVPFQVLEVITQAAGSSLVWCMFTGA